MVIKIIGERIRQIRTSQNLSQEQLAFNAKLDRTYIAGVESGRRNPTIKSLEKIFSALKISFKDFFSTVQC